jgi:hypothetical protein
MHPFGADPEADDLARAVPAAELSADLVRSPLVLLALPEVRPLARGVQSIKDEAERGLRRCSLPGIGVLFLFRQWQFSPKAGLALWTDMLPEFRIATSFRWRLCWNLV